MHATRATVHRSLRISPGALIFQRDMFLDIPLIADLITIQARRQHLINESLRRANMKRRNFDYQVGQQVLRLVPDPDKMQERAIGHFNITRVHCNGTLTIRRSAHVTERINIRRRSRPFKQQ
jgi:hypothetical protein